MSPRSRGFAFVLCCITSPWGQHGCCSCPDGTGGGQTCAPEPQREGGAVRLQQWEVAGGCHPLGLPQLPGGHPAGLSAGMTSSCLTAPLQIKGSEGILAQCVGSAWGTATGTQGRARDSGSRACEGAPQPTEISSLLETSLHAQSVLAAEVCAAGWLQHNPCPHLPGTTVPSAPEFQRLSLVRHKDRGWKPVQSRQSKTPAGPDRG